MAQTRRPLAPGPAPALSPDEPTLEQTRRTPTRVLSRVAIVVVILAIAVMWGFAFFGPRDSSGRLEDRSFPIAAEPVCKAAMVELDALPPAFTAANANERADVIVQGSDRLDRMIVDLRAQVPAAGPTTGIHQWLDDWSRYVMDRREYADELRVDPSARFAVTQSQRDKAQITKAVDLFATVNAMPSCSTPDDLGG